MLKTKKSLHKRHLDLKKLTIFSVEFLFDPSRVDLKFGIVDYNDKTALNCRAASWNVNLNYSIVLRHDIAIIRVSLGRKIRQKLRSFLIDLNHIWARGWTVLTNQLTHLRFLRGPASKRM